MSGSSITLATAHVGARLQELTALPVQLRVHRVEVQLLTYVVLGKQNEFTLEDCWRAVLAMHGYAYAEYDSELQYPPYTEFREDALYVWDRMNNPGARVADDPIRPDTPDDDFGNDQNSPGRRYEHALMEDAAYLTSLYFDESSLGAQGFVSGLDHSARFAIEQYYRGIWLDDPYALGVALHDPVMGSSPFGEYEVQSVFALHLANIIIEAANTCNDKSMSEAARNAGMERLSLLWPILKGYSMVVSESMNSPVGAMFDSGVIDLIEQALVEGVSVMRAESGRGIRIKTHHYSPDGVRCAETPTADVVAKLRNRAKREAAQREAMKQIR